MFILNNNLSEKTMSNVAERIPYENLSSCFDKVLRSYY